MLAKDEAILELTWNDRAGGEAFLQQIATRTNKLYYETYELIITFQDIEGRAYKQILKMEKAHCIPQPVTAAGG